jgi:hypothetical protein
MIIELDILSLHSAPAADDDERALAPAPSVIGNMMVLLAAGSSRKARVTAKVAIIVTRPSHAFLELRLGKLSDIDALRLAQALAEWECTLVRSLPASSCVNSLESLSILHYDTCVSSLVWTADGCASFSRTVVGS